MSNSFTVGYHNAYGQKQLDRTFTNYSVTVQSTTYSLASGQTQFKGTHSATVVSVMGSSSMTGTITVNRR